jgi:uncharacterized membrane protein YcaP (DUF421 family)
MNVAAMIDAGVVRDMFHLGLPILEKVLRPVLVYFALVILLRLFGKRELAQLNPFDLVVLLSLSNTVQNAIIGEDTSVTGGVIGAVSLLLINYLVVRFLFGHRRLDQIVEGKSTVLIQRGKVRREGLAREMLSESELLSVAHKQGFGSLADIEECVLEPGGTFFLKGKQPHAAERQHNELITRLDAITAQLEALKQEIRSP